MLESCCGFYSEHLTTSGSHSMSTRLLFIQHTPKVIAAGGKNNF